MIQAKNVPYKHLFDAARYSLLGGGKRIRPLLALLTTQMLGGSSDAALLPACCIELIHTYSMIHDDLPCMDDDDIRRGKPTLHRVYNEGHAVLTGDYLLTLPFELIARDHSLSPPQKVSLIQVLSEAAGPHGLIGGQVVDLLNQSNSLEELRQLHLQKTGALFIAAVDMGAILADAPPATRKQLKQFSQNFGLAFQILNDILDISSSDKLRGTEISSDVKNGKKTYVTINGMDRARTELKGYINQCLKALEGFDKNAEQLREFVTECLCP